MNDLLTIADVYKPLQAADYINVLNAKYQLEDSKIRNRLLAMAEKQQQAENQWYQDISQNYLAPQTNKTANVTIPEKIAPVPNLPLQSPGGQPTGNWREYLTEARVLSPEQKETIPNITQEQLDMIPKLYPTAKVDVTETQTIPLMEQAKALGVTISPETLAKIQQSPEMAAAAVRFFEGKKAEATANLDKKIGMIKDLAAVNPKMAKNLWNSDPSLKAMGEYETQNSVEPVYDSQGNILGHNVMVGGKTEFVKDSEGSVSNFKTFYKGYKQEHPGATDADVSRAWYKMKLDESRQRVQFGVSLRADTQFGDDFKDWTPQERDQAILRGLITGKGSSEFFSRGDRKNFANFSHASQKFQIERGITPGMVARMQADYKAGDKSLSNQRKIYDMSYSFVTNINSQIEKVKEIYSKLPRTQAKLLNIPIRELRVRAAGSGEEAAAASYLLEISNEIGKLSTGSAASIRELSESAQKQWAKIHDGTLPLKDISIVLDTTQEQANMRLRSQYDAMQMTRQLIEETGVPAPLNQSPKSPQPGKPVQTPRNGRVVINPSQFKPDKGR